MSFIDVKNYFLNLGLADRIIEFQESTATSILAARALNCELGRIAKTMAFVVNDEPIVVVLAGDTKADNSKFKQTFGVKLKMLSYEETEQKIGHKVGGVCPFVLNSGVKVYLDVSIKRFDFVYPACGSFNSVIKLFINELEKYSHYTSWVDISKETTL